MQPTIKKPFGVALRRAIWSGTAASIFSGLTVAWRGHVEHIGALRGINAVSHWRWGDKAFQQTQPSVRYTLPGVLVHHGSSIFWAAIYERWLQRSAQETEVSTKNIAKRAAGVTALAWFVDFHLTPKRLTPGFERVISKRSLVMTYAAFGCGLGIAGALSAYQRKKRALQSQSVTEQPRQQRQSQAHELTDSSDKTGKQTQKLFSEALNSKNAKSSPAKWMPPF